MIKNRVCQLFSVFAVITVSACASDLPYVSYVKVNHVYQEQAPELVIKYLGNTSIYFEDMTKNGSERTSVFIDAFVSRPRVLSYLSLKYDSDEAKQQLDAADVSKISYILPLHSHFDHVLDAPYVAGVYDAKLLASTTTRYIASRMKLDAPVAKENFIELKLNSDGEQSINADVFDITIIHSIHPNNGLGRIAAPLGGAYPNGGNVDFSKGQFASKFLEGDTVNVHLLHRPTNTTIYVLNGLPKNYTDLIAQEMPENLKQADIVFIGVPIFRSQLVKENERSLFWQQLLANKKTIVPVHWDAFYKKLHYSQCRGNNLNRCLTPFLPLSTAIKTFRKDIVSFQLSTVPIAECWLTAFGQIDVWPKHDDIEQEYVSYKTNSLCSMTLDDHSRTYGNIR